MGNLHQVVQLHAFVNDGTAHGRAVHTGIGTNLHIILDNHITNLWNLIVTICIGSKAEAICTDDRSGMNRYTVTDMAVVIDRYMRIDACVVTNHHIVTDAGKGSNVAVFSDLCRSRNKSQRINTGLLGLHALVQLQQLGHTLVCVLHADEGSANRLFQRYIFVDQDNA